MKRYTTNYPGVYYRIAKRSVHPTKTEKMYYASYYKDEKKIETPVGRQYKDGMPRDRASLIMGELLEGKRLTNKEKREKAAADAEADMELSQPCPFRIKKPKVNNSVTEDLIPRQLKRLMKALDEAENQKHANIMRMTLFTGMRRDEIFSLKWDHIDFEKGFIRIVDPKGGFDQTIPLNDHARAVRESVPREGDEHVFPSRLGGRLTTIKPTETIESIELPEGFRPLHGLRHVFASRLASSGNVDLYQPQRLLTHKSPTVTQRYAHLRDEALKKSSNLMGSLVKEAVASAIMRERKAG